MSLLEYAKMELKYMRDGEPMNEAMCDHIEHMVEEFSKEGHSGFSASYAVGVLEKLLRYEPLRPLTGEDDEWFELFDDGEVLQNKRCFNVFKDKVTGRTYDIQGKVFREPDGCCYTNRDSHVDITFPYTPSIKYVDRDYEGNIL